MAVKKIIKNQSGSEQQILNRVISNNSSYDIEPHLWLELSNDPFIESSVSSESFVVNDGIVDLISSVGLSHIKNINGVIKNHTDITLLSGITENAPSIAKLSNSVIGFEMEINDEIFGQSRVNNYAGGDIKIELHMAINNTTADRWIEFEVSYTVTGGHNTTLMNIVDGTLTIGPIEVPSSSAYRVFSSNVLIPASAMSSDKKYVFIGIKRKTATGKTAPTNHPIILRYCKEYYESPVS